MTDYEWLTEIGLCHNPQLVSVEEINIGEMLVKLKKHMPFLEIVELLETVEIVKEVE